MVGSVEGVHPQRGGRFAADFVAVVYTLLAPEIGTAPGLLAAQHGNLVDASSLEVEFVSQDEMQALAERYGDPELPFYYGLLVTNIAASGEEQSHVVWRQCSLASLQYGHEKAISIEGCPDGVVPLVCQDANEDGVMCAECQASSDRRHRDELENFSNRVVNIQQLNDDEAVPTSENLTSDANTSGRRRSRRIRPGSACTWPVAANATDTVYMLKNKIFAEIDALPIRQRLYYKGEMLQDHRSLKHYGYVTHKLPALQMRYLTSCYSIQSESWRRCLHEAVGRQRRRSCSGREPGA